MIVEAGAEALNLDALGWLLFLGEADHQADRGPRRRDVPECRSSWLAVVAVMALSHSACTSQALSIVEAALGLLHAQTSDPQPPPLWLLTAGILRDDGKDSMRPLDAGMEPFLYPRIPPMPRIPFTRFTQEPFRIRYVKRAIMGYQATL
jgi:hypothetical protein